MQKSILTNGSAPIDPNSEDFDFKTWSLGNGKVGEKRAKLEGLIAQLMDRNNRKLKKDHDDFCKGIKRRRNRGAQIKEQKE